MIKAEQKDYRITNKHVKLYKLHADRITHGRNRERKKNEYFVCGVELTYCTAVVILTTKTKPKCGFYGFYQIYET